HTIYRVEAQAVWNLHYPPGSFGLPSSTGALTDTAFSPRPTNDAIVVELNQQRALTRAVTQQAEILNSSLRDFSAALANTRTLAEQNRALHEQLTKAEHRLDSLEREQQVPPSV